LLEIPSPDLEYNGGTVSIIEVRFHFGPTLAGEIRTGKITDCDVTVT
jgi:hypothetical protein